MTATDVLTLSDFLLARIAEDGSRARAAAERDPAPWTPGRSAGGDEDDGLFSAGLDPVFTFDSGFGGAAFGCAESVAHIARWDPARVLAECEAKAKVVGLYLGSTRARNDGRSGVRLAAVELLTDVLGDALRALALPYADHPDYQQAWAR